MSDHETTLHSVGRDWIAVCSCGRWRSDAFKTRTRAENAGLAHEARGDQQNRAAAAQSRGAQNLERAHVYYQSKADDPLTSPQDRILWQQLADEARERLEGGDSTEDAPLW